MFSVTKEKKKSSSKFFVWGIFFYFSIKMFGKFATLETFTKTVSSQFQSEPKKKISSGCLAFRENMLRTCFTESKIIPLQCCNLPEPNLVQPLAFFILLKMKYEKLSVTSQLSSERVLCLFILLITGRYWFNILKSSYTVILLIGVSKDAPLSYCYSLSPLFLLCSAAQLKLLNPVNFNSRF